MDPSIQTNNSDGSVREEIRAAFNDRLFDQIKAALVNDNVGVLIRHSSRENVKAGLSHRNLRLTPEGRDKAIEFGGNLPLNNLVRIFYSEYHHCKETAECIRRGVLLSGGSAELRGSLRCLAPHFMVDSARLLQMIGQRGASSVAREWFNARIDEGIMENPWKALEKKMNQVLDILQQRDQTGIDIYITHDWNMALAKELLLGVRHEDAGWPAYLDGVVLAAESNVVAAWWKNFSRVLSWGIKGRPSAEGEKSA